MTGIARKAVPYGWCPTAYRPMMADDGYLVRVRPHLARLTAEQVQGRCDLAITHGNGGIEFTIRSNLQLRGVTEAAHAPLLNGLAALGLLDPDAAFEHRRNIVTPPFWAADDLSGQVHDALMAGIAALPELPAKVGFGIDCGDMRVLHDASADFRFERGAAGGLILRADGAPAGRAITPETAADALTQMAQWFLDTGGATAGRMARHLPSATLPTDWMTEAPATTAPPPALGSHEQGLICAAPAGAHEAAALKSLMQRTGAPGLRTTPWRAFVLETPRDATLVDPAHPWEEPDPIHLAETSTP